MAVPTSKEGIVPRENAHWTTENHRQRMTSKQWRKLLLKYEDDIIVRGRVRKLTAKKLFGDIVEVFKEPLKD